MNWVTSSLPLDEPIKGDGLRRLNDAPRVSAGNLIKSDLVTSTPIFLWTIPKEFAFVVAKY